MRIQTLSLEQFRSYDALNIDFSEGNIHVLVGPNGAGKTNVLESISILSLTKSCLGCDEEDLMQWEKEFYRIRANTTKDDGEELTLEVASQLAPRKKKACFRNDVNISVGEMVGTLPIVYFLPDNLDLFRGAPANRRGYLDQLLCQVSPAFLKLSAQYQKIIKQRNSLLRRIASGEAKRSQLSLWDAQVAEAGAKITRQRLELIEILQCTIGEEVRALGEQWENVQLVYDRKGTARGDDMEDELESLLEHYQERDVILQSTTVGPHREDWHMEVDGHSLPTFASRGQQRTAVLALLFLQVSFLELRRGEKPIILLDDVFSELDAAHQEALLQSFDEHQVIITTTHVPDQLHGAVVWEVANGSLKSAVHSKA